MADLIQFPDNELSREKRHEEATQRLADALTDVLLIRDAQPFIDEHKEEWETQGVILQNLRMARGFTASDVAKGIGVSTGRIKRLEAGEPINDAVLLQKAYLLFITHPHTQVMQGVTQ